MSQFPNIPSSEELIFGAPRPQQPVSRTETIDEILERVGTPPVQFGKSAKELQAEERERQRRLDNIQKENDTNGVGAFNTPKSLQDFFTFVNTNGLYTPTKYAIMFDKYMNGPYAREKQDLVTFQCTELSFPGKNFRTADVRTYGPVRRPVIDAEFNGELTLTFRIGRKFEEVKMFERWMDYISSPTSNYNVAYYDDYICNMFIDALDRDGKTVLYRVKLKEVYPKALDSIALGAARANEVSTVNVTFSYRNWTQLGLNAPDLDNKLLSPPRGFNRTVGPPDFLFESQRRQRESIDSLVPVNPLVGPPRPGDIVI